MPPPVGVVYGGGDGGGGAATHWAGCWMHGWFPGRPHCCCGHSGWQGAVPPTHLQPEAVHEPHSRSGLHVDAGIGQCTTLR